MFIFPSHKYIQYLPTAQIYTISSLHTNIYNIFPSHKCKMNINVYKENSVNSQNNHHKVTVYISPISCVISSGKDGCKRSQTCSVPYFQGAYGQAEFHPSLHDVHSFVSLVFFSFNFPLMYHYRFMIFNYLNVSTSVTYVFHC